MAIAYSDLLMKEWGAHIANVRIAITLVIGVFTFLAGANLMALSRDSTTPTPKWPMVAFAGLFVGLNGIGIVISIMVRCFAEKAATRTAEIGDCLSSNLLTECEKTLQLTSVLPVIPYTLVSHVLTFGEWVLGVFIGCWIGLVILVVVRGPGPATPEHAP